MDDKKTVTKTLKEYALITFGVFLVSIGVHFFKFPNGISTGGVTGIAVVLNKVIPFLSAANIVTILNIALDVVGFIFLGKEFGLKTLYGSIVLSGMLELMDAIIPISAPLTNQPVLELFYAVAFPAAGAAFLFYHHGSTGGTDIIAMIIRKNTNLDSGKALLCADFLVVALTFWNFSTNSPAVLIGLLSMLGLIMKSLVVDNLLENLNQSKKFLVITAHREAVEEFITKELKRSATVWECEGSYMHERQFAIVSVMSRFQAFKLRSYVKKSDPHAFIIITSTSDIIGKGFREI